VKTIFICFTACWTAFGQTPVRSTAIDAQMANVANLPSRKITPNDLIALSVYDAPELTRTVRVGPDGMIDIPMLRHNIRAQGLMPSELEAVITDALKKDEIIIKPIVSVTILEYNSRSVSVVGAVHKPLTFQVIGATRLLDALARAEGPTEAAGPELLLTRPGETTPERFNLKELMSGNDLSHNVVLDGSEEVRIPEARKIYVVGSVKKPGAVPVRENSEFSILRVLAVVEGVVSFHSSLAYVYRLTENGKDRHEIPVDLKKILARKAPDVTLWPDDILYIPERTNLKVTAETAEKLSSLGAGVLSALIYAGHL
jgi:polysaccharide biosynthesis/export protein